MSPTHTAITTTVTAIRLIAGIPHPGIPSPTSPSATRPEHPGGQPATQNSLPSGSAITT
jgi:hypothetical protein